MMRLAPIALAFALAPLAAGAQTMYRCVQGGKTVYQAEPCPDSAKQGTVEAPPRAGADAGVGDRGDVNRTIDIMKPDRKR